MEDLFFYDELNSEQISYTELIKDLNNDNTFDQYCHEKSYYKILYSIVKSLVIGEKITLIDFDFSENEIENLLGVDYKKTKNNKNVKISIQNITDLYKLIDDNQSSWSLEIFTSGTTGQPKMITHNYSTLTKSVRTSSKHENDIWGFCYNATHMAGLQVFFQAFLNKNPMIRLFQLEKTRILKLLDVYKITHISATPTFFRMLLPVVEVFKSVIAITMGGEKFDSAIGNQLSIIFPNARFNNIYASTEAGTLLVSENENFTIREKFKDLIIIKNNEILIHSTLLGKSDKIEYDQAWYHTNDLVEIISNEPLKFKFLSRKNEMINVGGNKVNPHKVEEKIRTIDGVKDCSVYGKPNKLIGNILVCDIMCDKLVELTEKDIRLTLNTSFQSFEIPRIINFVGKIGTTRTGKIKRI